MKEGQRCPNCFQGNIETGRCNLCGFDRQSEKQNPMRLPEMSQLGNRYLIGRMLGCGGFGITYKAYDRWNQCGCAIKEFTPVGLVTREAHEATLHVTSHAHQEDFEHGKKRFMEEAEILKKLTGVPEVVQITDYFQQNNTAYFVMEYIQGANLRQLMHSFGGKIPFKDAASIIYRAGMALEQVHNRAGIFHRDISPENIMVNQEGKLKLIDFGSAKYLIGRHSQTLSVILKKGYAPPEQYSSTSSQGSYTDVYALAATFYYVVTGVMISLWGRQLSETSGSGTGGQRRNIPGIRPCARFRQQAENAVCRGICKRVVWGKKRTGETICQAVRERAGLCLEYSHQSRGHDRAFR